MIKIGSCEYATEIPKEVIYKMKYAVTPVETFVILNPFPITMYNSSLSCSMSESCFTTMDMVFLNQHKMERFGFLIR